MTQHFSCDTGVILHLFIYMIFIPDYTLSQYSKLQTNTSTHEQLYFSLFFAVLEHEYSTIRVAEHTDVNLWCNISDGSMVQWYMNTTNGTLLHIGVYGRLLQIRNITRECSLDTFVCKSDTVTKEIKVITEFAPFVDILLQIDKNEEADIKNQTVNQHRKDNTSFAIQRKFKDFVTLECEVESSPYNSATWKSLGKWIVRHIQGHNEVQQNAKHPLYYVLRKTRLFRDINEQTTRLKLTFQIVDGNEFGDWVCESENDYGMDQWTIEIQRKE